MNQEIMNKDKIKGGFLGLALGDALGAPFEFRFSFPLSEYTGKIDHPIVWKPRFSTKMYSPLGQVTDDTSMTIALMESIHRNKGWVKTDVIKSYMSWANSGIRFLGKNTRSLFKGIKTLKGYQNRYNRIDLSNNQSNGSLMRAFSLVLLFHYKPSSVFDLAVEDTKLTNPSPINQDCVLIYLRCASYILQKIPISKILTQIYALAQTKELKQVINQVLTGVDRSVTQNKGWILHSMYCALMGLSLTNKKDFTFQNIINWVVLKGGDTDTNAAITGSLLGLYHGYSVMKQDSITKENIDILLKAKSYEGSLAIDKKYHPKRGIKMINFIFKN